MRRAVSIETDQGPVPSPDRTVVQPQMAQRRWRVVVGHRQQYWIFAPILLENLETGSGEIASPHADAARRPARAGNGNRLFEQWNARFLPQALAEQERRVCARR